MNFMSLKKLSLLNLYKLSNIILNKSQIELINYIIDLQGRQAWHPTCVSSLIRE